MLDFITYLLCAWMTYRLLSTWGYVGNIHCIRCVNSVRYYAGASRMCVYACRVLLLLLMLVVVVV